MLTTKQLAVSKDLRTESTYTHLYAELWLLLLEPLRCLL
jgi:hypothetical protein